MGRIAVVTLIQTVARLLVEQCGEDALAKRRFLLVVLQQGAQVVRTRAKKTEAQAAPRRDAEAVATIAEARRIGRDEADAPAVIAVRELDGGSIGATPLLPLPTFRFQLLRNTAGAHVPLAKVVPVVGRAHQLDEAYRDRTMTDILDKISDVPVIQPTQQHTVDFDPLKTRRDCGLDAFHHARVPLIAASALGVLAGGVVAIADIAGAERAKNRVDQGMQADIANANGRIKVMRDPAEAIKDVDLVITDTWVSMGDLDANIRRENLAPYRVDETLMAKAKPDALFMHCLPAHRGDEVTSGVMDGPQSVVFDEAENRLHAQKAVLAWVFGIEEL